MLELCKQNVHNVYCEISSIESKALGKFGKAGGKRTKAWTGMVIKKAKE